MFFTALPHHLGLYAELEELPPFSSFHLHDKEEKEKKKKKSSPVTFSHVIQYSTTVLDTKLRSKIRFNTGEHLRITTHLVYRSRSTELVWRFLTMITNAQGKYVVTTV